MGPNRPQRSLRKRLNHSQEESENSPLKRCNYSTTFITKYNNLITKSHIRFWHKKTRQHNRVFVRDMISSTEELHQSNVCQRKLLAQHPDVLDSEREQQSPSLSGIHQQQ